MKILYIKDNNILFVDYRLNLAKRMLVNKKGSLIGAVLAVSIGILVISVNSVIFQGIYDAIIRDMSDYRFGDIYVYDEERSTIQKSDIVLINWFERIPNVEAATPRLEGSATAETRIAGQEHEKFNVPVLELNPPVRRLVPSGLQPCCQTSNTHRRGDAHGWPDDGRAAIAHPYLQPR